jgi:hypothetical protein
MQDGGRCFTNFMPICQVDEALQAQFRTPSNMAYRLFLERNADTVMAQLRKFNICTSFDQKDCDFCLPTRK